MNNKMYVFALPLVLIFLMSSQSFAGSLTDAQLREWLIEELNQEYYELEQVSFEIEPIMLASMPEAEAYRATFVNGSVKLKRARFERDATIRPPSGVTYIRERFPVGHTFPIDGYIEAATNGRAWLHTVSMTNRRRLDGVLRDTVPRHSDRRRHVLVTSDEYQLAVTRNNQLLEQKRLESLKKRNDLLSSLRPFLGVWKVTSSRVKFPHNPESVYGYKALVIESSGSISITSQRGVRFSGMIKKITNKKWSILAVTGRWDNRKNTVTEFSLEFRRNADTLEVMGNNNAIVKFSRPERANESDLKTNEMKDLNLESEVIEKIVGMWVNKRSVRDTDEYVLKSLSIDKNGDTGKFEYLHGSNLGYIVSVDDAQYTISSIGAKGNQVSLLAESPSENISFLFDRCAVTERRLMCLTENFKRK